MAKVKVGSDIETMKLENKQLCEILMKMKRQNKLKVHQMRETIWCSPMYPNNHKFRETEKKVLTSFIGKELKHSNISIERAYRSKPVKPGAPDQRSNSYLYLSLLNLLISKIESVRKSAHLPRGTAFGVSEQFPMEIWQR